MSKNTDQVNESRRDFLHNTAAATGSVAVAGGAALFAGSAQAKPVDEAVTDAQRWGILVDTTKCSDGCNDCVTACAEENGWIPEHESRPATDAQWIRSVHLKNKQTGSEHDLPLMCQHCEHPPCVDVCPTGASFRRDDGIVLVDKHICIGCRYCMMACPYKARSFVHEAVANQKSHSPRGKGTVESCTLCVHRVDDDQNPACVEACDHKALTFGDLKDPNSEISKQMASSATKELRASLGLNTGVRYKGL